MRGIRLAVHWSFVLLLAYVGEEGWRAGGWPGLVWYSLTLIAFFGCVVLHELGHSFTAMHFGIGVRRILLMPIGGMAEFDEIPRQPRRELLITLAGPAVNFAIAAALWWPVWHLPEDTSPYSLGGLLSVLWGGNLVMGCFNLLPAFPMDGGRILRAALAWRIPYLRATRIAATIGKAVCVAVILAALLVPAVKQYTNPYLLVVLFLFIFYAGEAEYRFVRRRELEDAHWRTVLERMYGPDSPSEPPLLTR